MFKYFIQGRSGARIANEDLRDKILSCIRDGHVIREGIGVHPDLLIGSFYILGLERGLANDQSIDNNPERPHIDFIRVASFTF
jgi:hypothetical protein